jgi:hypothetical protein
LRRSFSVEAKLSETEVMFFSLRSRAEVFVSLDLKQSETADFPMQSRTGTK